MADPNYRTIMSSHDFYDEMNIEYLTGKNMPPNFSKYYAVINSIISRTMMKSR